MNPKEAAEQILSKLTNTSVGKAKRDPDGKTSEHAGWMLYGVALGYVQYEKAHRWLGYAQAILVTNNIFSLAAMKEINRGSV